MKHLSSTDQNNNDLTNVPTPVAAGDAANKGYVDSKGMFLNVKDFGAVGDGVNDDAFAISAALAGGNKRVYIPEGNYRVRSYLRVQSNTEIEMHPKAVILNDLTSTGNTVFLNGIYGDANYSSGYSGDGNITIRGGTIDCQPLSDRGFISQALAFAHTENVLIENVRFINNRQNHFVEINSGKHVRIRDCHFEDTVLTEAGTRESINIDYSFATGFPHFGGYDDTVCEDVIIEGCSFVNGDVSVGSHSVPTANSHKNIKMVNCYIEGMASAGISPQYWTESLVQGNTIRNSGARGIRAWGMFDSVITANTILNGCTSQAITVDSQGGRTSSRLIITENVIKSVSNVGIYLGSSIGITVAGNVVTSSVSRPILVDTNSVSTVIGPNTFTSPGSPMYVANSATPVGYSYTDANGWTVYDDGYKKTYYQSQTGNPPSINAGSGWNVPSLSLPVGVSSINDIFVSMIGAASFSEMRFAWGSNTQIGARIFNHHSSALDPTYYRVDWVLRDK